VWVLLVARHFLLGLHDMVRSSSADRRRNRLRIVDQALEASNSNNRLLVTDSCPSLSVPQFWRVDGRLTSRQGQPISSRRVPSHPSSKPAPPRALRRPCNGSRRYRWRPPAPPEKTPKPFGA